MDLLEIKEKREMSREQAAGLLRQLADSLARHNAVDFQLAGKKISVKVPERVTVEIETEVESEESSIEVEIKW